MPSDDPGVLITPVASRGAYQVLFGVLGSEVDLGLVDEVDPTKTVLSFEDITTGSTGKKNVLGQRFVGAKVMITVKFRQITLTLQKALSTWYSGTGTVPLTPPLNADMYAYSQSLILHPTERSDTLLDLHFDHAVCLKVPLMKRDNGSDDVVDVDFAVYPDRPTMNTSSGVSTLDQGYIKAT